MKRVLSMAIISGAPALVDQTGRPVLTCIRVGMGDPGSKSNWQDIWAEGQWTLTGDEAQGEVSCENARIEYRREGDGIALKAFYTHAAHPLPAAGKLIGLSGLWRCGFDKCLHNDFSSANGTLVNEMCSRVLTTHLVDGQVVSGAENMALIDCEGSEIIAGYISFEKMFPGMDAGSEGRLAFWQQMENHPLAQGETVEGDWLYIGLCDDVRRGLIDYAKLAGRYMNTRAGIFDTPYGYCTWYYYGNGLCPETVYENLQTLRENKDRLDVKYFNLDNGWLKEWGDWTENEKFACGMKKIADDIYAEGYLPGIWLAPFGGEIGTKIYEEHPDWFVRRWDGQGPIEKQYGPTRRLLALDMSHPEVKRFITETFRRITHEWGYRHVKIDIITNTLAPGRHYDPSYNSLMNYREGLRLMREAMTEDSVLLACTAPMGPSIGYADGMRTSGDIFHDWNCLKHLFNQNLKRYYYNKTWFCTDPDCLIVRNGENEDEACIRPCIRTEEENRTFAAAVMATGGAMIMSDKMPLLKEYQLELLSWMYPINTQAAIPLDLMDSYVPGVLDLGRRGKAHIFVLINWTDARRAMKVDVGEGLIFEFWAQKYLGRGAGTAQFEIEPHASKIILVTDEAPAAAIGVNDCLCPTMEQQYEGGELSGRFLKKNETIFVAAEATIEAVEGCTVEAAAGEQGIFRLKQTGECLSYRVRLCR